MSINEQFEVTGEQEEAWLDFCDFMSLEDAADLYGLSADMIKKIVKPAFICGYKFGAENKVRKH